MSGASLAYRRSGRGTPLVLVHGYLGGSAQWQAEADRFSARFDVIAPDLPGFGQASSEHGCDTINAMAVRIIALLDELGVGDFILLGHSMGGMIAQEIAAIAGNRVSRLILYGTGPLGLMPDRFEPIETSRQRLRSDGVARTIKRIGATWFCEGDKALGFPLVERIGAGANPDAALAALTAMEHWDGRPALPRLKMPSLIIWGHNDRSYRWPQVETLWQTLPHANLAVIPGTAHAIHLEKPELFQAVVEDFLGS